MGHLMLTISFHEMWEKRVGGDVTPPEVEQIIAESVPVQHSRVIRQRDGAYFTLFGIYYHKKRGLIIKIDEKLGRVVAVVA